MCMSLKPVASNYNIFLIVPKANETSKVHEVVQLKELTFT